MNKCKRIGKRLAEYIDGTAEGAVNIEIETHLKGCPVCRKEKELLAKTWGLLEDWPGVNPSPYFKQKFWKRVEALEGHKKGIVWPEVFRWRLAPALAVISILIITSSIFIKLRRENINLVKDINLYQNLEIIQNMDLLADLEFLIEEDEYEG